VKLANWCNEMNAREDYRLAKNFLSASKVLVLEQQFSIIDCVFVYFIFYFFSNFV